MTSTEAEVPALAGMRTMLDSAAPRLIPGTAQMVAGYVDGSFEWPPEAWDRFSGPRVRITVEPFNSQHRLTGFPFGDYIKASVIDKETGAFSTADTARFVPARDDFRPGSATVYVQSSSLEDVLRANRAHDRRYWIWLAWYIRRVPTAADVAGVVARLAGFNATLAAWQHTPGPRFDTSAVVAAEWHKS